jgi:hypothetical protein
MNRQTLSRATAATLLGAAVLVGGGKSYASDADDVKATIDGFHCGADGARSCQDGRGLGA